MPIESLNEKIKRTKRIDAKLRRMYPNATTALRYENPLQLLISTILAAQCTDERVNMVTPSLFAKYRSAEDFARARQADLEAEIRSTGFFRQKAKSIISACRDIVEKHGSAVPDTMDALTSLAGVGRKTANVVLGTAFNKPAGVVVDTHVTRLSQRLGLSAFSNPAKIEQDLMKLLPPSRWVEFSHSLVLHGRRVCFARKPDCEHCRLADDCPSAFTFPHNKHLGPQKEID